MDILNKKVIKQIPIGFEAQSVVVDTNEHKVYVSFHDIDKIVKINGNNNEIETVIQLDGRIPNDMTVDPTSHKLYASIKYSNNLWVMGPEAYSVNIPVVTKEPPILYVDNILSGDGGIVQYKSRIHGYCCCCCCDLCWRK